AAVPRKRAQHVLEPALTVLTHPRRPGARTDDHSARHAADPAPAQPPCEGLRRGHTRPPLTPPVHAARQGPWRGAHRARQAPPTQRGGSKKSSTCTDLGYAVGQPRLNRAPPAPPALPHPRLRRYFHINGEEPPPHEWGEATY